MSKLEKFALQGGGIPDILTWTMSELEKFAWEGGILDILTRTMSELEKFALQGGGYPRQCPRYPAPGLNLPLKHWHTLTLLITGFWLWLAFIFSPQDGRTWIHGQTNISAADKHEHVFTSEKTPFCSSSGAECWVKTPVQVGWVSRVQRGLFLPQRSKSRDWTTWQVKP